MSHHHHHHHHHRHGSHGRHHATTDGVALSDPRPDRSPARRLTIVLLVSTAYLLAEVVGGLLSNSLALLADAGHMLSDVAALAISLFAVWLARRPATLARSFGYRRGETLAALANAATLLVAASVISIEAVERLRTPHDVHGLAASLVAAGGLLVNLTGMWLLHEHRHESLNVRGAWLHLVSDALGSLAAIAGGLAVSQFAWHWADPLASLLIALLVLRSGWSLLAASVHVLMEHAPADLDPLRIARALRAVEGVANVHDLHVWSISSRMPSLSAHVTLDPHEHAGAEILDRLQAALRSEFGISHATLQLEQAPTPATGAKCGACSTTALLHP